MKQYSQDLSALIDNELDDKEAVIDILNDGLLQKQFSRYQLMGDVIRDESNDLDLRMDVTDSVMAAIANQQQDSVVLPNVAPEVTVEKAKNNVIPFMKRFGQYAIAASVASVVVVSSLMVNQSSVDDPGVPVLNTIPFGGAVAPVSLQAPVLKTKSDIQKSNERLEALLKDHQLQLQTKP